MNSLSRGTIGGASSYGRHKTLFCNGLTDGPKRGFLILIMIWLSDESFLKSKAASIGKLVLELVQNPELVFIQKISPIQFNYNFIHRNEENRSMTKEKSK